MAVGAGEIAEVPERPGHVAARLEPAEQPQRLLGPRPRGGEVAAEMERAAEQQQVGCGGAVVARAPGGGESFRVQRLGTREVAAPGGQLAEELERDGEACLVADAALDGPTFR